MDSRCFLVILGEREALRWVLQNSRMAFPPKPRRREVHLMKTGDQLLLVTTRGCFHNPTRDRTRVIGNGTALGSAQPLQVPYRLGEREFPTGCDLDLQSLTPYRTGVELAPLLHELEALEETSWASKLRRPLVELGNRDRDLLMRQLGRLAVPPERVLPRYLAD
jgi:hypothetical protein